VISIGTAIECRHVEDLASRVSHVGAILTMLVVGLGGCALEEAIPDSTGNSGDAGSSPFADLVISFSENGLPVSCGNSIGAVCSSSSGSCTGHASLGAPDSLVFEITGQNSLEVGLLCHPIIDRSDNGGLGNDFRIWATVNSGSAVVSVSDDGSTYTVLQSLSSSDQAFDLAEQNVQFARFVRITGANGNTSISIDAIEAL